VPGAIFGFQVRDAAIAELLKPLGYATGFSNDLFLPVPGALSE
jgi:hypothetical protein